MTFQFPNHQVKKKNGAYLIKTAEKAKQLGETQERPTISAQPGTSGKSDKKTNDVPDTAQIRTCHSLSCEFTSDPEHVPFYHGQRAPLPKESNDLLDDHYIQSSSGGRLYAISKVRKRPAHSAPQEHRPSFENPRLYHKHKRKFFIDIDGHTHNVLDSDRKFFYPPDDRKSFYPSDYRKFSYPPDARKSFYPPNDRKSFYPPDDRKSFYCSV
uniref:Uncharacterized protein n=1 Tax=Biomphalaria glabrata TaxID=6526 RepID=A0A2C9KF99_BIOGL